jgi:two-component system, NarL family, response regulator LiaR
MMDQADRAPWAPDSADDGSQRGFLGAAGHKHATSFDHSKVAALTWVNASELGYRQAAIHELFACSGSSAIRSRSRGIEPADHAGSRPTGRPPRLPDTSAGSDMPRRTLESRTADPAANKSDRAVRVLVADEDATRRKQLRAAMVQAGLSVVGQAAEASQTVYLATRCLPDVILVETTLPPAGGVAAMRALAGAAPGARVVFLAGSGEDDAGLHALMDGAAGYLPREMDLAALARAASRVVAGEPAITRAMSLRLIERLRELSRAGMRPIRSPLTTREWEILDLLTTGASTAEIAQQLVLSTDTVRSHVNHILRKLRVHSRREAVELAEQLRKQPGYR